jgi:hypothetical protein
MGNFDVPVDTHTGDAEKDFYVLSVIEGPEEKGSVIKVYIKQEFKYEFNI